MESLGRFKISELAMDRLLNALKRRVADVPHAVAWNFLPAARENKERIRGFQGKHVGQRCFIMGNGPSLNETDLTLLRDEITFGLNRIYLLFDKITCQPTYYVCINELVLEQFSNEIRRLNMPKFLNWNRRHLFDIDSPNVFFVGEKRVLKDSFERDLTRPLSSGGTVTFIALQIAHYMGFREVILIGLDHHWTEKGVIGRAEIRTANYDQDHFHPDYFPKGAKWEPPDLVRTDLAYTTARKAFEEDGRRILDATPNGKCQVFEKTEFSSLFD